MGQKEKIKRIFHHYSLWEDYKNGMWDIVSSETKKNNLAKAIEFTGNHELYGSFMFKVIEQWPVACEHNLSDIHQNRQAWIGHAACSMATGITEDVTREAWGLLSEKQQEDANKQADLAIKEWEKRMQEKIKQYVRKWESQGYEKGIPDQAPEKLEALGKVPSYRHICRAIMKNDVSLSSLGFARMPTASYSTLKKIEIENRNKKMNVYDASVKRIDTIFKNFDNIYVSFSGGKDSGVLLNLCIDYIRKNNLKRKIGVFHIDYEAQYQMTTDFVNLELEKNKDIIDVYRICLPIAAKCATSMHQSYWIPWDADKKDLWVRPMPDNGINESNHEFDWFNKGMWDYELQEKFSQWFHEKHKAKKTCCLVGIRTDESLNRWRAIHSDKNKNKFKEFEWTLELSKNIYNAYPIFDFKTEDVWIANYRNAWEYNKLYDLFYKAGVPIGKQRVASPFHDSGIENLKLYKVIDPNNWGKMVGRTNGVNFAGLYGGTTAMGWRNIKLPPGHTWKSYMEFLLTTLPTSAAEQYKHKLEVSKEFWRKTGGCLSNETIKKLKKLKISFKLGPETKRKTDKTPVLMEYQDDCDIEEFQLIPSYKRMVVCILKNDFLCKYMGFSLNKTETQIRAEAERKYSNIKAN